VCQLTSRRVYTCLLAVAACLLAACDRGKPTPVAPAAIVSSADTAAKPPLQVAAFDENGLHVATVTGDHLSNKTLAKDEPDSVGWLDEHTLVTSESTGAGVEVTQYVDDEPPRTIVLEDALFQTSGSSLTNVVFVGSEIWIARCSDREQEPCKAEAFVRASPGAHERVTELPPGARRSADNYMVDRAWPTVAAPRDAAAKLATFVETSDGERLRITGVECTRGTQTSRYPSVALIEGDLWGSTNVRWVHTSPPIYEVVSIETTGGVGSMRVHWLRACDQAPFDAFAAFSDNLWAGLRYQSGTAEGTWEVWRGDQLLGSLPGGSAIRANR